MKWKVWFEGWNGVRFAIEFEGERDAVETVARLVAMKLWVRVERVEEVK